MLHDVDTKKCFRCVTSQSSLILSILSWSQSSSKGDFHLGIAEFCWACLSLETTENWGRNNDHKHITLVFRRSWWSMKPLGLALKRPSKKPLLVSFSDSGGVPRCLVSLRQLNSLSAPLEDLESGSDDGAVSGSILCRVEPGFVSSYPGA